jgi:hypothetical protein
VSPADVPAAAAAAFTPEAATKWPGAAAILPGIDVAGERELRPGDRVLYGIELARGDRIVRKLLRIEVVRGTPAHDLGTLTFHGTEALRIAPVPARVARLVELEFTLFEADGRELQRSRSDATADYFLEESFVAGIVAARSGDVRTASIASARLLQIVRLLQQDTILKQLLAEVASIPFDLRLLFRRDITLVPDFANGAAATCDARDPFSRALGVRFDLPFDLLLNDSAFVRLSATVTDPRGPTGAAAGIVLLRAQQASDPTRQVRLYLLACARGERTEWQRSGVLTRCGSIDEGVALAFAPDGRFVATPGARGEVELRDLRLPDPTVPVLLAGARDPVGALAFLDDAHLLVGRGARVELFAVGGEGAKLSPVATLATERTVSAIEVAGARTCFVAFPGGEVQRWTFAADGSRPAIEEVRAANVEEATLGDGPPMPYYEAQAPGALLAGDERDRVVFAWHGDDSEFVRGDDGTWRATALAPLADGIARLARWRRGPAPMFESIGYGGGFVTSHEGGARAFGGSNLLLITRDKTWSIGRGAFDPRSIVHGFSPGGRCYVFVSPGYRVFVDPTRTP